jgi:L-lactate dehydrogenase complex protein LldG
MESPEDAGTVAETVLPDVVEERRKTLSATENPGRAAILERIRTGLSAPAPEVERAGLPDSAIFEPVQNPLERFQQEAKANLMECLLANDAQTSAQHLQQVLQSLPRGEIFVQDDPSLRRMIDLAQSGRAVRWSSQGGPSETSQATVSLVEALIAQTGSIFVTATCGGRGASVVAPCHIAVATLAQLVPDLRTALGNATKKGILDQNSFACVISGSSRTADIEKILVQGAHGPRRLVVIVSV